ncbi:MAG: UDP-N-acetylmuramate--L-alanine ligase [Halanaerobiales bacterium]|nr:UDP-N-acetylmuramate--L-alanine ligase [Halanaerobiales bacterium]
MNFREVHIVGIGGISMSGIAKILLNRNIKVTGSDLKMNDQIEALIKQGVKINIGHREKNINKPDAVVFTSAVSKENVEILKAKRNNIRLYKRAEFIAKLFKDKKTLAVAGTHGKTTTTSMLASVLINSKVDPAIMVGGNLNLIGGNVKEGKGDYFITEADESDGSFVYFNPTHEIITNIEWDHFDYYKNEDELINKFDDFINKLPEKGKLIIYGPALKNNLKSFKKVDHIYTYGLQNEDFFARDITYDKFSSKFDLYYKNDKLGNVKIDVPGEHNILNAVAVIALCYVIGFDFDDIKDGLLSYKGVKRRFEKKGKYNQALIIDDYAHHPTEIINTLITAKRLKHNRLFVVFQPHRYSRTASLIDEFSQSFDLVDNLIITDIYSASEKNLVKISSKDLVKLINKRKNKTNKEQTVNYIKSFDLVINFLEQNLKEDDILITVGAGDVYKIGERLLKL